ncbi:MAG: ABC-2 type transport system ATP-binding protein [Halobacteriales archaeon]|jgi:ABC-2 type transport system ATP-binding protein
MSATVVADEVRRVYGDVIALDGVSLSVEAGEVFVLIGPNGAGKTTLVRALTGTTEPSDGTAALFGSSPASVDRSRLGVLPQAFRPYSRLTPQELLDYYAGLYDEVRSVEDVLSDVGLVDAADVRYENLSGGQQRRTCLGVALVNDPDLLFLDEPTTGIDPAGRRTVQHRIADLAAGGTTVFLTTHDMAEAERLADRVGLLAKGKLVARGSPAELIDDHGGDRRLVINVEGSTSEGVDALADDKFETEITDGELRVYGVEATAIGNVVAALEAAGIEYTEVSWSQPSLEDVYLSLTGETFDPHDKTVPATATGAIEEGEPT